MNKNTNQADKQFFDDIINLVQTPNTALSAIHQVIAKGQVSKRAIQAIYQRVMSDKDCQGAYYLVCLANKYDDLPFDGLPLIQMVLEFGDDDIKTALLHKLPNEAKMGLKQLGLIN